jgi:hypothetical protein
MKWSVIEVTVIDILRCVGLLQLVLSTKDLNNETGCFEKLLTEVRLPKFTFT